MSSEEAEASEERAHEVRWWDGDEPVVGTEFGIYLRRPRGKGALYDWAEHSTRLAKHVWDYADGYFLFLGSSAVSGVVGNFTYAKVQDFAKRRAVKIPDVEYREITTIALLSVRLRCAELQLPAPPFDNLRVTELRDWGDGRWGVTIVGGDRLEAKIVIPGDYATDPQKLIDVQLHLRPVPGIGA